MLKLLSICAVHFLYPTLPKGKRWAIAMAHKITFMSIHYNFMLSLICEIRNMKITSIQFNKYTSLPATCAAATEVPLMVLVAVLLEYQVDVISSPGANRSTQDPQLEKLERRSLLSVAAIVKAYQVKHWSRWVSTGYRKQVRVVFLVTLVPPVCHWHTCTTYRSWTHDVFAMDASDRTTVFRWPQVTAKCMS